jgi:hypothetical protein
LPESFVFSLSYQPASLAKLIMFLEVYQNNFLFLQVSLVLNPIISFKARFFETLVPLTSALDQDMWLPSSFSRFTSRIIIEY